MVSAWQVELGRHDSQWPGIKGGLVAASVRLRLLDRNFAYAVGPQVGSLWVVLPHGQLRPALRGPFGVLVIDCGLVSS